ncbi:MAG TPA: hypothetical protein VND22_01415 [Actinomycetota bacterium]|nr:hypothetical protein [Actinomycetota bacterium]
MTNPGLSISQAAEEVLERAHLAAIRFNPDARIRVYRNGDAVETGLADAPGENDFTIRVAEFEIYVESGVTGTLDVSTEHDRLIVS